MQDKDEKLYTILRKKQAIHSDHGGGTERLAGVCDHHELLCMAESECFDALP